MRKGSITLLVTIGISLSIISLLFAHEKKHPGLSRDQEHWKAPSKAAKRVNPVPYDAASIVRGRGLFLKNCVACHGREGGGDGPVASRLTPKPPDLAKMGDHHSDGDLAWKIENGRGPMPAWKDKLRENEIWDVTNFIKSLRQRPQTR